MVYLLIQIPWGTDNALFSIWKTGTSWELLEMKDSNYIP